MNIKTILTGLSGRSASSGTCEIACRLAVRFNAQLTALHVRPDFSGTVIAEGAEGLAAAASMRSAMDESQRLAARREQAKVNFAETVARHGLTLTEDAETTASSTAAWQEKTGDVPTVIASRARFFDLIVLGRSDRVIDAPHTDAIEQTLIRSGRPVLLAPAQPPETLGETVAFAWNGSAQAVRALVAALPFLRPAKQTLVITVGDEGTNSSDDLLAYLRIQGVAATLQHVRATGGNLGDRLLGQAHSEGADLVVVGGYGHTPWREALFGGTTNDLIGRSLLPLLLAH